MLLRQLVEPIDNFFIIKAAAFEIYAPVCDIFFLQQVDQVITFFVGL
ncbi:MAG: hypothetical protein GY868_11260 [Deltaproteobacteria bacterium]|nr:hypothetical protein [Deltaproteobacteria bacterium]